MSRTRLHRELSLQHMNTVAEHSKELAAAQLRAGDLREKLTKLEYLAWRLACHDHAAAERERAYQCVELQHLIDYFEANGVEQPDGIRVPASSLGIIARA